MQKHYNRFLKQKIVLIICTLALLAAIGYEIGIRITEKPAWDTCYEMTNTNVSWLQTYYPSSRELADK